MSNKTIRMTIIGFFLSLIVFLGVFLYRLEKNDQNKFQTVGLLELVAISTPSGPIEVTAKIDTGADFSAIDRGFANSIGLPISSIRRVRVVSSAGVQERDAIPLTFVLGDKVIESVATLSDRTNLSTDLLIGKNDLSGLVVDPNREYLTKPRETGSFHFFSPFIDSLFRRSPRDQILIIFPILGALVVLERIIIGFRTFGLFAPVVIAVTLFQVGIIEGMLIYAIFLVLGMAFKILLMKNFQFPHIAEVSLLMFLMSLVFIIFTSFSIQTPLAMSFVFFPLIITSHLIERASKAVEEHKISEAVSVLFSTLAMALFLAICGALLFRLPVNQLWALFIVSIIAILIASQYKGLRLSEFIRFKFLENKR